MLYTLGVVLGVLGVCFSAPSVRLRAKRSGCQLDDTPRIDVDISQFAGEWYVIERTNGPYSQSYSWDGSVYSYATNPDGSLNGLFSFKNPDPPHTGCIPPILGKLEDSSSDPPNGRFTATVLGIGLTGSFSVVWTDYNSAIIFECYAQQRELCSQTNVGIVTVMHRSIQISETDRQDLVGKVSDFLCVDESEMLSVSHASLQCMDVLRQTSHVFKRDIEHAANLAAIQLAAQLGAGFNDVVEDDLISFLPTSTQSEATACQTRCRVFCEYGYSRPGRGCPACACSPRGTPSLTEQTKPVASEMNPPDPPSDFEGTFAKEESGTKNEKEVSTPPVTSGQQNRWFSWHSVWSWGQDRDGDSKDDSKKSEESTTHSDGLFGWFLRKAGWMENVGEEDSDEMKPPELPQPQEDDTVEHWFWRMGQDVSDTTYPPKPDLYDIGEESKHDTQGDKTRTTAKTKETAETTTTTKSVTTSTSAGTSTTEMISGTSISLYTTVEPTKTKKPETGSGSGANFNGCPQLKCGDGPCLYGSVQDSDGCDTCECVRPKNNAEAFPCTQLDCPPCAFGSFKNRYGCATCRCKEAPMITCDTLNDCNLVCVHGYMEDVNGCSVCNCSSGANPKCVDTSCENKCPDGRVRDELGCDTCECACPKLDCWDGPCVTGSVKDKNECDTCECTSNGAHPCPELACPPCPNGSFKDKDGCESCNCKHLPEVACSEVMCALFCENGFKKDEFNCDICECSDEPKNCLAIYCEKNCTRAKGPDGCEVCECATDDGCVDPNCWDGPCVYGSELDANGCETCECKTGQAICPPTDCPPCPFGSFKNRYGCETCSCKEIPQVTCRELQCNKSCQFGLKADEFGCPMCECSETDTRCVEPFCENACATHRVKGPDGCDTCECACQELQCWDGPCKYGSGKDQDGCPTCDCLLPKNSSFACPNISCVGPPCGFGSFKYSTGCPSCICKGPPEEICHDRESLMCSNICPNGYRRDTMGCYSCDCAPEEIMSPEKCPFVVCNDTCPNGFVFDEADCATCVCNPVLPDDALCREPLCENSCELGRVRDDNGCETCECVCPTLQCWDGPCIFGSVKDISGCDTCECIRPMRPDIACPLLDCPRGPCYFGSFKDKLGCDSCKCKKPPEVECPSLDNCKLQCDYGLLQPPHGCTVCMCAPGPKPFQCPLLPCPRPCPTGFLRDERGCHTCQCDCPPIACSNPCPTEYLLDENGCPTCQCKGLVMLPIESPNAIKSNCTPPFCENDCPNGRVKDRTGCDTCECVCPKLNCWDGLCRFGSIPDSTGCDTCQCTRPKEPTLACPFLVCKGGPCKYGSLPDKNGCASCKCLLPPPGTLSCPEFTCDLKCTNGYVVDEAGCQRCECLSFAPPPPICEVNACPVKCKNGYRVDEAGCLTCECKCKYPSCWDGPCRYGSVLDKYGCPSCDCLRPEFPTISCGLLDCRGRKCKNGFAYNRFGCLTCRCNPDDEEEELEEVGSGAITGCDDISACPFHCLYGNKVDDKGCSTCECNLPPDDPGVPLPCPMRKCVPCEHGYAKDENGCDTCECVAIPMRSGVPDNCQKDCSTICGYNYKMRKDENGCEICTCTSDSANEVLKPGGDYPQNDARAAVEVVVGIRPGSDADSRADELIPVSATNGNTQSVGVVLPEGAAPPGYHVAGKQPVEPEVVPPYQVTNSTIDDSEP